jgi:hypothetical protein
MGGETEREREREREREKEGISQKSVMSPLPGLWLSWNLFEIFLTLLHENSITTEMGITICLPLQASDEGRAAY